MLRQLAAVACAKASSQAGLCTALTPCVTAVTWPAQRCIAEARGIATGSSKPLAASHILEKTAEARMQRLKTQMDVPAEPSGAAQSPASQLVGMLKNSVLLAVGGVLAFSTYYTLAYPQVADLEAALSDARGQLKGAPPNVLPPFPSASSPSAASLPSPPPSQPAAPLRPSRPSSPSIDISGSSSGGPAAAPVAAPEAAQPGLVFPPLTQLWCTAMDRYLGLRKRMEQGLRDFTDPTYHKLLPDKEPWDKDRRKTLVLDLDELLVYKEWTRQAGWKIYKRPGVQDFLLEMAPYYELVLFTDTPNTYADPIISKLDPYRQGAAGQLAIQYRLYRPETQYHNGKHVRDLSKLNRDLSQVAAGHSWLAGWAVLMLSANPGAWEFQPENTVKLQPWRKDQNDTTLLDLIPMLQLIATRGIKDVRDVVRSYDGEEDVAKAFKARMAQISSQQKQTSKPRGLLSLAKLWQPGEAAITKLACTRSWPPTVVAIGLAPCVRAWVPRGKPTACEFEPVVALQEMDGCRFTACCLQSCDCNSTLGRSSTATTSRDTAASRAQCFACACRDIGRILPQDDLMATGDDAPEGHVMIWDIQPSCGWRRLQTLETSAPVVTLVMAGSHLAAGTASGSVVVWRRDSDGSFQPLFSRPLTLDSLALRNVALTTAPDGTPLLVVQASGRNAIGMWRLVRSTVPYEPPPLSSDYDGQLLVVGFDDGALVAFGIRTWLRWLGGAVGAVVLLRPQQQVLSGSADGQACLWSSTGQLLASCLLGFPVTALAQGDIFAAVGGAAGQLQLLLLTRGGGGGGGGGEGDQAAQGAARKEGWVTVEEAEEAAERPRECVKYDLHFDFRRLARLGPGERAARTWGTSLTRPQLLAEVVPPPDYATAQHFRDLHAKLAVSADSAPARQPAEAEGCQEPAAGGACTSLATLCMSLGASFLPTSPFDAASLLLRHAPASPANLPQMAAGQARDAARAAQLRQMGESAGVARSSHALLPSSVELLGRKCDNVSCLVRSEMAGAKFS
ncbi:hypothetical protein QJQ45_018224, partial [Haematococcus lacustris]